MGIGSFVKVDNGVRGSVILWAMLARGATSSYNYEQISGSARGIAAVDDFPNLKGNVVSDDNAILCMIWGSFELRGNLRAGL